MKALMKTRVLPEWVDYNGHLNDAEYARLFSLAVEALLDHVGLDEVGRRENGVTVYTLETHLCYLGQAYEGQELSVTLEVLDRDSKRLHVFFRLRDEHGQLLATSEQMLMAMALGGGRPTALPAGVNATLEGFGQTVPEQWPEQAGRRIGIRRH
ncbi:acyl-CoA thioester hydrolase [Kushneria sinocarnis]|uniref:Acyl-CoA thioester hydrolase n=1 Tax=Kushneria sinocarnis TaxID=595502 RepID=A0A420WX14_9GAMM|nr:thioesterase family protein [Kushneria sinocarnis]RKR04233.1 acyl-CoA thioester hydrolase [Kushneria sinocarnis]